MDKTKIDEMLKVLEVMDKQAGMNVKDTLDKVEVSGERIHACAVVTARQIIATTFPAHFAEMVPDELIEQTARQDNVRKGAKRHVQVRTAALGTYDTMVGLLGPIPKDVNGREKMLATIAKFRNEILEEDAYLAVQRIKKQTAEKAEPEIPAEVLEAVAKLKSLGVDSEIIAVDVSPTGIDDLIERFMRSTSEQSRSAPGGQDECDTLCDIVEKVIEVSGEQIEHATYELKGLRYRIEMTRVAGKGNEYNVYKLLRSH